MLILGIDTSGKSGGVTLAEASQQAFRTLGSSPIAGGTFSAQLVPTIASLLAKHCLSPNQIRGFAVASGPGSFTGLRVGLSVVKGLAEVLGTPIVTVSVLQAVAAGVQWAPGIALTAHPLCRVALDASRGEVFFGEYECLHASGPKMLSESLISLPALAADVHRWGHAPSLFTPDPLLVETLRRLVPDPDLVKIYGVSRPTSEDIARTGLRRLLAGETVSPEALDANYLRRSDAELFFKNRP
jgi:tRNA threonylcarbamoyladenosine biosynthesis protein TsaB